MCLGDAKTTLEIEDDEVTVVSATQEGSVEVKVGMKRLASEAHKSDLEETDPTKRQKTQP